VSADAVQVRCEGPVATITLNRPDVLNAIDMDWIRGLQAAVDSIAERPDVRVVVIRGRGRAFCAGLDLDMVAAEGLPGDLYERQESAFRTLELLDPITIAAIHGHCLGGGVQLAIACDLRICGSDGRLGLPAVNEGLFPALATYRLPRLIGMGPARRLILSGETVTPDEALRLGMVDYLVPADRFEEETARIVERFQVVPVTAARASKRLMRMAFEPFERVYEAARPMVAEAAASDDLLAAREARAAGGTGG
jgi:enoyl-CoA hydratase/carnithine racemase